MKTFKFIVVTLSLAILMVACSNSESNPTPQTSCQSLTATTNAAEVAYNNANSSNLSALCNAYKTALQNEINGCGDANGDLQGIVADLGDCTVTPTNRIISVAVGTLVKTFETNLTVTTVGTTRQIRAYDNMPGASSDYIYFEIPVGATGSNKISNFNLHLISSDYNITPVDEGGIWSSAITVNSSTVINGTFYGYVTSPTTGADLSLTQGTINISL